MSTAAQPVPGETPHFVQLANDTVNLRSLNSTLLEYLATAAQVHGWLFQKVVVVTSGNDGKHVAGSKHYLNQAVDLRSADLLPDEQALFLAALNYLAQRKGICVFDERQRKTGAHFHVELA